MRYLPCLHMSSVILALLTMDVIFFLLTPSAIVGLPKCLCFIFLTPCSRNCAESLRTERSTAQMMAVSSPNMTYMHEALSISRY